MSPSERFLEIREALARERHVRETAERESHQHATRTAELYIERDTLRALLAEAAEALAGSDCHSCGARLGLTMMRCHCRECRPTRALLERLRGSR